MRSLFIGRYQPFHKGHKALIDKVLREGALLGQHFFEDCVPDYLENSIPDYVKKTVDEKKKHDDIRHNLVTLTKDIYVTAKDLESIDTDLLQFLRNRYLQKYG